MTYEEIPEDFPVLSRDHILAALAFTARREEIIKVVAA
jgi:uncharacterized protein (DUF433 family)